MTEKIQALQRNTAENGLLSQRTQDAVNQNSKRETDASCLCACVSSRSICMNRTHSGKKKIKKHGGRQNPCCRSDQLISSCPKPFPGHFLTTGTLRAPIAAGTPQQLTTAATLKIYFSAGIPKRQCKCSRHRYCA